MPYAAHRMALAITADTGRSPLDCLDDFASFYFDTALSASPATFPSLLAFAQPGHVLFGSDWPFAPAEAGRYFAAHLDTDSALDEPARAAIDRTNALRLFPRFGAAPPIPHGPLATRVRRHLTRATVRAVTKIVGTR